MKYLQEYFSHFNTLSPQHALFLSHFIHFFFNPCQTSLPKLPGQLPTSCQPLKVITRMGNILSCHIHILMCIYGWQQAVFRAHLFPTLHLIFQVTTTTLAIQTGPSFQLKVRDKPIHRLGRKVQVRFHVPLLRPRPSFSERWALTYIAADISFGCSVSLQGSFYVPSENCLQRVHTWHRRLCRLLLAAHRGLHTYYTALMKEISQLQQTPCDTGGYRGGLDLHFILKRFYRIRCV